MRGSVRLRSIRPLTAQQCEQFFLFVTCCHSRNRLSRKRWRERWLRFTVSRTTLPDLRNEVQRDWGDAYQARAIALLAQMRENRLRDALVAAFNASRKRQGPLLKVISGGFSESTEDANHGQ